MAQASKGEFGQAVGVAARIPLPTQLQTRPFTAKQGLDAGIGRKRMRSRDLTRPFYGVRLPSPSPPTLEQRCHALALQLPHYAFFCGSTAAALMGIPLPPHFDGVGALHVAVPFPHHAPHGRGVSGHSVQVTDGTPRPWHGLPISTPERTWCELGAPLALPDLVAAGDYLIHWRFPTTTAHQLQDAVACHPARRGKSRLIRALGLLDDRAESPQESRLRVIIRLGNIPGVEVNVPITTSAGFHYRGDLVIPDRKVIIEYQGDYHRDREQYRKDMTRVSRLEADGWYVMLVNANDLMDADELVRRIRTVLMHRPQLV